MSYLKSLAQPAPLRRHATAAAVALAAALCSAAVWATPPVYRIVDLPGVSRVPASQQNSVAGAINKNGDVAGYLVTYFPNLPSDQHKNIGAIWPADGSAPILLANPQPQRPDDNVIARGINNSRWVAGFSVDYHGQGSMPELWTSRKTPAVLATPGFGQAVGINEAGVAVGYVQDVYTDAPAIATFWTVDGQAHQIGSTPGSAAAINTSGSILGNMSGPFIRDPAGNIRHLNDLPGQTPTGALYAWAMNDLNQAVGTCDTAPAGDQYALAVVACLWQPDGTVVDLGRFNDGQTQRQYLAWGINNGGQVLGFYSYFDPSNLSRTITYPTLWTAEDGLMDLRTLVDPADPLYSWVGNLTFTSINDQGVIIGNNYVNGHGVKLVPNVPPRTVRAP